MLLLILSLSASALCFQGLIPDYVNQFAPLVYLDVNETYFPSDLQGHLDHTYPTLNFTAIPKSEYRPLTLSNLQQLNSIGHCTGFKGCEVYLTSKEDLTKYPKWMRGVRPDPVTHKTLGVKSCVIVVNDHGAGWVDAYYLYFYSFNEGPVLVDDNYGNHLGDIEHTMVRFKNGSPTAVFLSQHSNGEAFTYKALEKRGVRPVVYSAKGSHAVFPTVGHRLLNDTASAGFLWDPTLSAYYYKYPYHHGEEWIPATFDSPIGWQKFLGRWGDKRLPDSDPRQNNLDGFAWKWDNGIKGPEDLNLNRTIMCRDENEECPIYPDLSGENTD